MKRTILALTLAFTLACGNPQANLPGPPNSPVTATLNADRAFADGINTLVKTAIQLRASGKVTPATVTTIEAWARVATKASDDIATIASSGDAWPNERARIIALLPLLRLPSVGTVDPILQASLTSLAVLLAQLQTGIPQ